MLFKNFPSVNYPLGDGQLQEIKDILIRVGFDETIKDRGNVFVDYQIQDSQTPEKIAEEVYGDSQYHWVVLLFNELLDPLYDFPLRSRSLDDFVDKKYPSKTIFLEPVGATQEEFYTHYVRQGDEGFTSDVMNFREGDTITVYVGLNNYKDTGQDAVVGVIKKFIPELSAIEFQSLSGKLNVGDIIARGYDTEIRARVKKIIDSRYSVHHFEENGVILNPMGTPPDVQGNQVPLAQTGPNYTNLVGVTQTILENYINDNFNDYVITNEENEFRVNTTKQSIKLLSPELIDSVARDLRRVINR